LGPSKIVPPKPVKIAREIKPPRSDTRIPQVRASVQLGVELLALRSTIKSNRAFGRQVRAKFDIDAQHASEVMKVARIYAGRNEITTRLSWDCLVRLASASMPAAARRELEARLVAGEKIVASDIVRARQAHAATERRSDQLPLRIAA
jgi:propanediol dehydratase large subunit